MGKRIFPRVSLFAFALLLVSCATVKQQLNDPSFVTQNQPIREVRVLVATDGSNSTERIDSLIAEASGSLEPQIGIRLKVIGHKNMEWPNKEPLAMLQRMHDETLGDDSDLVIGFGSKSPGDIVKTALIGGWHGVIDDTFRRYIVMPELDRHDLMHEICHAFILSHAHSDGGLMQPVTIYLMPGVPLMRSEYLTSEDRTEILKNKWRNFQEVPAIAQEDRKDTISQTKANMATGEKIKPQQVCDEARGQGCRPGTPM